MKYPEIYPPEDATYHPKAVGRTLFLDRFNQGVAETILAHLRASDAPVRVAQLRVLGGAMARVPVEKTAFAQRSRRTMANVASFYQGTQDQALREAWVTEFAAALGQGEPGAYVNFLSDEGPDRVREAYPGRTWDRLAEIKRRFDPTNLFRLNQNIPPAMRQQAPRL
jgi:hypothetical protein